MTSVTLAPETTLTLSIGGPLRFRCGLFLRLPLRLGRRNRSNSRLTVRDLEGHALQQLGVETGTCQIGDEGLVSHVSLLRSDEGDGRSAGAGFSLRPAGRASACPDAALAAGGAKAEATAIDEAADVAVLHHAGLRRRLAAGGEQWVDPFGVADELRTGAHERLPFRTSEIRP